MKKPQLVYDGECGFCKRWLNRMAHLIDEKVERIPYQSIESEHPDIDFSKAIVLLGDGEPKFGAEAIFRTFELNGKKKPLMKIYSAFPLPWEAGYQLVAQNRRFFSKLLK